MTTSNAITRQGHPVCFIVLLITYSCLCYVVDTRQSNCLNSGLNILKEKDVKRFKATFDLKSKLVFYRVFFCQSTWICLATTIDESIENIENNIVKNEELWTKLISTILGFNHVVPYQRRLHGLKYGSVNDYFDCHGKYYIINSKPTRLALRNVSRAKAAARSSCLDKKSCSRTCLHAEHEKYKCQEIRLQCSFNRCSKEFRDITENMTTKLKKT